MGLFDAIIQTASAKNVADTALAQGIGAQFSEGIFQGREERQLNEAETQLLEEKFAAFSPSASEQEQETFLKANLAGKRATIGGLETTLELERSQLESENIQSQIDLRTAQAAAAPGKRRQDTDDIREFKFAQTPEGGSFAGTFPEFQSQGGVQGAREIKIQDSMNTLGMSRADAIDLADGNARITQDPNTGRITLVNIRTSVATPINVPINLSNQIEQETGVAIDETQTATPPAADASEESKTLFQLSDEFPLTGVLTSLESILQKGLGQEPFNLEVIDPKLTEALQTFETAQSVMRRSLRSSSRFLATENEILAKEIDIRPGAFTDPQTLVAKMTSVRRSIIDRVKFLERKIKDPNTPTENKEESLNLRNDLNNFLRILGDPISKTEGDKPPPGIDASIWEVMTPEEKAKF